MNEEERRDVRGLECAELAGGAETPARGGGAVGVKPLRLFR